MRILLIDDHALLREGLILLLTRSDEHIEVVEAANLADARMALQHPGKPVDLVLLDLRLEDNSAPDAVTKKIIPLCRGIPVVVISGETDPRLVRGAIEAGAMAFIPKTLPFSELSKALTRVLRGDVYLPASALLDFQPGNQSGASPTADPAAALAKLPPRQMEILRLAVLGFSNLDIADKLGIAEGTVKTHMGQIFRTLKVNSRVEAVYLFAQAERARPEASATS